MRVISRQRRRLATSGPPAGRRADDGFALIGTLALMAIFSLTIVALLGLTFTSIAATTAAATRANELRAVDGSLETAVNRIRTDPTAVFGSAAGCDLGAANLTFDQGTAGTADDVVTALQCCPNTDIGCTTPVSAPPLVPVDDTGRSMTLLGESAGGELWPAASWREDCLARPGPGCLPWSLGIGTGNYGAQRRQIGAYDGAALVHSGPTPLEIVGDVSLKHGAVAMRNPAVGPTPAVQVSGEYRQGDAGLFWQQSGGPCGQLSPTFAWTRAGTIEARGGGPTCADPGAASLDDGASLARPGRAVGDAVVPDSCPGGPVVTLTPGNYDAGQTARLNRLLAGSCSRTYHFTPGDYWFDVDDPSQPVELRNSLTINDPSSQIVFGSPRGWDPAVGASDADFPDACHHDPGDSSAEHDGVAVTLSSRTSIRHLAGRVAMCGHRVNGATLPVIWQDPAPNGGWAARPTAVANVDDATRFSNPGFALDGPDDRSASRAVGCQLWLGQSCAPRLSLAYTGWSGAVDPGSAPLRSAVMLVHGNSPDGNGNGPGASTTFEVYPLVRAPATYAAAPLCTASFPKIADRFNTVAFDLLQGSGNCASFLTDRSQLNRAKIVVSLDLRPVFCFFACEVSASIDSVQLVTDAWTASSDPADVTGEGWDHPERVLVADGSTATAQVNCSDIWFVCASHTTRSITMRNLRDASPGEPLVPSSTITSVGVVIKGSADTLFAAAPVRRTTFTVTLADARTCTASFTTMAFDQQFTYYDLLDTRNGTCAGPLFGAPSSVLFGATVKAETQHDCYLPGTYCPLFAMPNIDLVQLMATSVIYTRPRAAMRVTVSDDPTGPGDARFSVFGPVSIPHSDIDVLWAGPDRPTTEAVRTPVFGGSLVARSLGSAVDVARPGAAAGLVCCGPAAPARRTVRINARIAGVLRGTALIEVGDASGGTFRPGADLRIVDWRTCGSEGCT